MKFNVETQFNIGDKVYYKDLVTNETLLGTIKLIHIMAEFCGEKDNSCLVCYHTKTGDILTNINNESNSSNSAFATREECNKMKPYVQ